MAGGAGRPYSARVSFVSGLTCGLASALLLQPLDVVKTRLQLAPHHARARVPGGSVQVARLLVREGGYLSLWTGLSATLVRTVPGIGLYFATLNGIQGMRREPFVGLELVALGAASRSLVTVALMPVTLIKARYESGLYRYTGVLQGVRHVARHEGFRGLLAGTSATVVRDAPFSGLYLWFYTGLKEHSPASLAAPARSVVCGLTAGFAASMITQPADVVKTRMQVRAQHTGGAAGALAAILQEDGIQGFFRGMLPRVVRRTLVSALSWTIFELTAPALTDLLEGR